MKCFSDGVVELIEAGVITNARKQIQKGQCVATFLMGTDRLYNYVNDNPSINLMPVDVVNDPKVICQNDNVVSINSCVEVDLMGQVASESVGMKQISGVGGQVDVVRATNMSKGGRTIMQCRQPQQKERFPRLFRCWQKAQLLLQAGVMWIML